MKVSFENGVGTYSGKYDQVVYTSWFSGLLCYGRKFRYPTLVEAHEIMGAIATNLDILYKEANPLYVADLKEYAQKNTKENFKRIKERAHPMPSSKSLFISCMWKWYKKDPTHIDLKTVTLSDIMLLDSPVQSVSKCVDAGFLKRVTDYETYTNLLVP
ncbi:MAG: hypothetical protein PHH43_06420 [Candidatus Cloacimonetes bacterium]|nr:hypothetical protein [Candidatus Cloacimonadota bacterium]MDD3235945.1 hypothetical protein [Candidatus Cloacimonadota bacterium]